ncbi:hypothetical protein [Planococcus shenhongbingii]|uniref:O-antigen ligase domain-containing protein n=1 Tax=Planococcus shenhongbingii TaxID=3058398 RepID=A0ABT8NA91_9BACL|nr:hypothetical protein [Planococcus sp. N017]MDN7244582.1 hypothetical protein [Planococcus sp. N017]
MQKQGGNMDMQQSLTSKLPKYIPILVLTIFLAILSAYSHPALLYSFGILIYVFLVFLAINENLIKAVLPVYLFIILFQDTIAVNLELLSPSLGLVANYMDEAFLLVGLSALAINFLKGKKIIGGIVFACLCSIAGLGFFSGMLNAVPFSISLLGAFLVMKGLLYLFLFMNFTYSEQDLKRYVIWAKRYVAIVLIFAVVDLLLGKNYRYLLNITYEDSVQRGAIHSLTSLFMHPGIYGWFLVFAGIYALAAFKVKKEKYLLALAGLLFLFGMLSFRFKAMMAVLVVLAIFYILKGYKKVLTCLLPLFLVLLFFSLFAGSFINELTSSTINNYVTADIYDSARKALYVIAYEIGITNFPFGEGFGRYGGFISKEYYSPVYYEYGINVTYGLSPDFPSFITDTYWPHIVGEIGFIGATIVAGLYSYLAVRLLKNYSKMTSDNIKIFLLFAGLVMVQAIVESLGEPIFNGAPQNVFIFVSLGIAFSLLSRAGKVKNSKVAPWTLAGQSDHPKE